MCEKCLRTQLAITICGDLDEFPVFAHPTSLLERLRGLRRVPRATLFTSYADFAQAPLPAEYRSALSALIRRSRRSLFRKRVRGILLDIWPQLIGSSRKRAA